MAPMMEEKKCTKCGIIKPLYAFEPWRNACRECRNEWHRKKYSGNEEAKKRIADKQRQDRKSLSVERKAELSAYHSAYQKLYHKLTPDERMKWRKAIKEERIEVEEQNQEKKLQQIINQSLSYREKNKAEISQKYKEYCQGRGKAKMLAKNKRRDAAKINQCPAWANQKLIQMLYFTAQRYNELYPEQAPFHVDHIIPLRGKRVSGFHVEYNLRVIPAKTNMKKHNKIDLNAFEFIKDPINKEEVLVIIEREIFCFDSNDAVRHWREW